MMSNELRASQLVGSYRVDELLASGGMGSVYRAQHTILPRSAAIKVLHTDMIGMPTAVERMLQEARILESIDHPTVVKIYDAGLLPDGRPWVAMELLDGQTLADHLLVHGRLRPVEAARIVLAVADALARSHSAGVVHRDVKPENIMLTPGPFGLTVKVIDWGIAHVTTMEQRITQHECSPGTPCYMSPEQLRGQNVDGRTDIWALGVVAYEMLAGEPPFDGPNPLEIAVKTLQSVAPRLPPGPAPPNIDRLIARMLAKEPSQRPSLDEVRESFRAWEAELDGEYAELSLEVEIDMDFAEARCVSGEIVC